MAGSKEITVKIRSIGNTRKVTSALEMVSASKIRNSQELMNATRPYTRMTRRVMAHLSKANPEYRHPFTVRRAEIRKVGYIIVSTDRGLCGKELLADCLKSLGYTALADSMEAVSSHIQKLRWKTRVATGFDPQAVPIPQRFTEITTWKGTVDTDYLKALQDGYAKRIVEMGK